jgi:transposase-like protein
MNLFSLAKEFPTEEHALAYWIKTRWPEGIRCLACDHDKCYLIETKGKTGKPARLFECAECGLHFSATTGTLFHDSHLPLQKWFTAIALMVESKKGISASQVRRHIGVTYKTAWFLCHRIRQAMQEDQGFVVGGQSTTVEIDEMYVGGRKRLQGVKAARNSKSVVLGIAERDGQIHMQTLKQVNRKNTMEVLDKKLDPATSQIVTDGNHLYKGAFPEDKHVRGIHRDELKHKNL